MENEPLKILVLDDDEDDTYLICDTIESQSETDYIISVSHNPSEAAEMLRKNPFDIVLCDYLMGATSGIDFIKKMRSEGIDTPIILLTGMGTGTADQAALEAGASDFISKINVTPEVIDRAIRYSIANAERQRLFQTVLDNVNAAVVLVDDDYRPTLWNPEFTELAAFYAKINDEQASVDTFTTQMVKSDRIVTIKDRVLEKKVSNTSNNSVVIILHDVTEHVEALREREAAEKRAAHLAMYCSMTGLPNRNAFSERIDREIAEAEADGREFYLLNLDLNKFKAVNDIYGHYMGDQLLNEVSRRLVTCCGNDDYIARLGGDEFMAIQKKLPGDPIIPSLAKRIAESVNDSISLDDMLVETGVSIGVAVYPHHGRTSEELMSNADVAMYRAKADPLHRIYAFDEAMDKNVRLKRQIGQELRKAIEKFELDVHFQPQADMLKGTITGFEALARWNHKQFGPIPPSTFIPIAEDNGLITQLGELVLIRACEIAAAWETPCKVAVNISPVQIRHVDLVELVQSVLIKTGLSPSRLELEITESVLIEDTNRALHVLRGIKNLGVSIALDDFGTGYSSLSTMISFPFDKIKIDRSFVDSFARNHQAAVITRAMINMAQQLDYRIIAEGVETNDQVEFLLKEGCHEMQGYLIGRPIEHSQLEFTINRDEFTYEPDTVRLKEVSAA